MTSAEPDRPAQGPPLRIMVLSRCATEFGSSPGGVDVLARRHASILAAAGNDVVFVGTVANEVAGVQIAEVRPIDPLPYHPKGKLANELVYFANEGCHVVQAALAGAKVQRRTPVDIAISNSSLTTLLIRVLTGRRPIVHYIHDGLYQAEESPEQGKRVIRYVVNNLLETIALRHADRVICASDRIATQANSVGIASDKLSVMYPLLKRTTGGASDSEGASDSGLQSSRPYILSVGQQTGRKRFDLIIRALRGLPEELQLVLVGDGPLNAEHRALARELGLEDRVVFLTMVPDRALTSLYQQCAAYVLASENEGFPITVAEALTQGCPVIFACPSTLGLPHRAPNRHLVLLKEVSEESLRRAIRAELREPGDIVELRHRIRRWASDLFPSEEEIQSEYQRIFRALVPSILARPAAPTLPAA